MLYEDKMTVEELRAEVRKLWDGLEGLALALRDLPEMADLDALRCLAELGPQRVAASMARAHQLQAVHGLGAVPAKSEYEGAAVFWSIIREAMLVERDRYEQERAAALVAPPPTRPVEPRTDC